MRVAVRVRALLAAVSLLAIAGGVAGQQAGQARAVLFFSPTCPHCHQVMTVDLPPLVQEYGDRLQIVTVNTTSPGGQALYRAAVQRFAIPDERVGVPTLIMGSTVLVGSGEIPVQFPGMVQRALASGGVDWPDLPELRAMLVQQGLLAEPPAAADSNRPALADSAAAEAQPRTDTVPAAAAAAAAAAEARAVAPAPVGSPTADSARATSAPADSAAAAALASPDTLAADLGVLGETTSSLGMRGRFALDPTANTVAVIVLALMLVALAAVAMAFARDAAWRPGAEWLTPVLALAGVGVAGYLAFVEVSGTVAVCGPVGDCNTVQQSSYARLGVLPVGVAGVVGYLLLLAAWLVAVAGPARHRPVARVVLWGATLLGTLFSVYLTFLEPFVIGATCAWCIASALLMTALLLLATPHALAVRNGRPATT